MSKSKLLVWALGATLFAGPALAGPMQTITLDGTDNFGSDDIAVKITIEDIGDDLKFTVDVLAPQPTDNIADLRGVFFDITNDALLPGLSASGADVTDSQFSANNVINLGNGANLNGDGNKNFDIGVEIGTQGIGGDDIQSTMFLLQHASVNLDLSIFANQTFGVRATSTGPVGSNRDGSSKLKGCCTDDIPPPPPPCDKDCNEVPEPNALLIIGSGLLAVGATGSAMRRRRRQG